MRWTNEVTMRRFSMTGLTVPGTCRSVKSGASGNSSQNTSRQRSPPRIPVSQSWTRATLTGGWPRGGSARRGGEPLPPVVEEPEDLGAPRERELGHVAADEAGDAGDQDPHAARLPLLDRREFYLRARGSPVPFRHLGGHAIDGKIAARARPARRAQD